MIVLDKFKSEILGKKGELTQILKNMKNYDENERRKVGKAVNDAKNNIEAKIEEKREIIKKIELSKRLEKIERVDFSLPVNDELGSLHPITVVQREIEEIFRTMGFTVEDMLIIAKDKYKMKLEAGKNGWANSISWL